MAQPITADRLSRIEPLLCTRSTLGKCKNCESLKVSLRACGYTLAHIPTTCGGRDPSKGPYMATYRVRNKHLWVAFDNPTVLAGLYDEGQFFLFGRDSDWKLVDAKSFVHGDQIYETGLCVVMYSGCKDDCDTPPASMRILPPHEAFTKLGDSVIKRAASVEETQQKE